MSLQGRSDEQQVDAVLVSMVNQLLEVYHIPKKILNWWEIDSTILITIYKAVFCKDLSGTVISRSRSDEVHNINRLVITLEEEFHDELQHISGEGIVRGNKVMLMNLLDIFKYMMEYVLEDIRSISSGSENGDYDRYSPTYDPDMVTPEVIDDILERELSRNHSAGYNSSASQHRSTSKPASRHTMEPRVGSQRTNGYKASFPGGHTMPGAEKWQNERLRSQTVKDGTRAQGSSRNHTNSQFYSPEMSGSTRELIALGEETSRSLSPFRSSRDNTDELIALGKNTSCPQSPPTKDVIGKAEGHVEATESWSPGSEGVLKYQRLSGVSSTAPSYSPAKTASPLSHSQLTTDVGPQPSASPHVSDDCMTLPQPSTTSGAGTGGSTSRHHHSLRTSHPGGAVTSMSASAPSAGRQLHTDTTSRTDPELEAILAQNPIMASTGRLQSGLNDTRQSDTYFEDNVGSRLNGKSGPTMSRSFDNLHSLMEDTAAMAQRAVARSPLREERPLATDRDTREHQGPRNNKSTTSRSNDVKQPQNSNVAAWVDSTSTGATSRTAEDPHPLRVADQLAPPRQSHRDPTTYEEYLMKYYGSLVRPRNESEDEEDNVSLHSDSMYDYGHREVTEHEDSQRESKKSVRFRLQEERAPQRTARKQGQGLRSQRSQQPDAGKKQAYVDRLYQWELDDFREDMAEHMTQERSRGRELNQEYQRKVVKKPKMSSAKSCVKRGGGKRSRPRARSLVKPRRRSVSSSPTVGTRRPLELNEDNLLPALLEEFPYLHLSRETLHDMWRKSMRQVEVSTRAGKETRNCNKMQNQIEETERRHQVLADIMKKEIAHVNRMRDVNERQRAQKSVQTKLREKRQQSARARRYYDEYQVRMRAKMLKKRTKEEMIFKKLFQEGLDIQRERAREMRRYAKDQRDKRVRVTQDQIASIENYYRDQYEMLAEAVAKEKQDLSIKEKAQSKALQEMAREFRKKMEKDIQGLQEQIYRDEDEEYWRQLDADRLRHSLQLAKVKAKVTA